MHEKFFIARTLNRGLREEISFWISFKFFSTNLHKNTFVISGTNSVVSSDGYFSYKSTKAQKRHFCFAWRLRPEM